MTNGSVAGTVNAPTPVSHIGTEIGHAGSEDQLRKGSNSQWPTQSEQFKRPFYSQPGTLGKFLINTTIWSHRVCNIFNRKSYSKIETFFEKKNQNFTECSNLWMRVNKKMPLDSAWCLYYFLIKSNQTKKRSLKLD